MAELTFLGNLLGMPNVFDPMFPLAYSAFFGASGDSGGVVKMETDSQPVISSNVSSSSNAVIQCMLVHAIF